MIRLAATLYVIQAVGGFVGGLAFPWLQLYGVF